MTLRKSSIPIVFKGLDTKSAPQLSVAGRFLVLENAVRRKSGKVEKRNGFTSLSTDILASASTIDSGKKLAAFNNDIVMASDDTLYSYVSSRDEWASKGNLTSVFVSNTPIIRNSGTQSLADMAHLSGFTAVCWEDSAGGVKCSVYESSTGSTTIFDTELSATGSKPKVCAVNGNFVFTYIESNAFKTRVVSTVEPGTLGAAQTIAATGVADEAYDVDVYNSAIIYAYNDTDSDLIVGYINYDGVAGTSGGNGLPTAITAIASAAGLATEALSIIADPTNAQLYIIYYDSATDTDLKVIVFSEDLTTSDTDTIEATISNVAGVSACLNTTGGVDVYYQISAVSDKDYLVRYNTVVYDGAAFTVGTAAELKRSVGLYSKPFLNGDYTYVNVVHDSALQPTYFTVRSDGLIVTRMLPGNAGELLTAPMFTRVPFDSDSQPIVPLQVRVSLTTEESTTLTANKGLQQATLDFTGSTYENGQLGENLHIAGGIVNTYDGVNVVEHSFHVFPEDLTNGSPTGTGGNYANGETYAWKALYEWVDAKGQLHRSAPSVATSYTAAAALTSVSVTVPTLRLTGKSGVKVVLYRTVGNGTIYYRSQETDNDTSADTVTIVDDTADTDLSNNEILYTTGGVLENIAPPACQSIVKHKNRLFLLGLEDGNEVQYSKEHVTNEGVQFSDALKIRVDSAGGALKAAGSMDGRLFLFKKSRIFVLSGDGPVDTGAQNDFRPPEELASDVGTEEQDSVVLTPVGLMFKSAKGIYLLNRSLQVKYVGAPVEDFNSLTITSATVIEDQNEVRFTTSSGACLVYNYYFDEWSTFTNYSAVSAINGLGTYLHLKANGTVNKEIVGQFDDNGSSIKLAMETSWLSFAGLQGFQRVYWLYVLGEFEHHHYTTVKLAYDFENYYTEQKYFNTQTGLGTSTYGDDATYGDSDVYGGTDSTVFQFRLKPARQKCQSVKIRIEDIDTLADNFGGSFSLTNMSFIVGRKSGNVRLKGVKTI